jgi:hypothetical protein
MVLTYFLNDFEMVPVAPIIIGITLVFTFNIRCISIVRSLYFKIFSAYYYYYYYYYLTVIGLTPGGSSITPGGTRMTPDGTSMTPGGSSLEQYTSCY